jgi:glycosyltransferase involved in cell wall biosynthesis
MSLISVVIPCYNSAKWLPQTLASVLAQTFQNIEIIAIDDGSTDNTLDIFRSFGNKVKFESGPNKGVSAARNIGTKLAAGEFIQYLDADDILLPTALEQKFNVLEQHDADVAYSNWQKLEEQSDHTFEPGNIVAKTIAEIHADPQIALFSDFWAPPAALLYRRRIIEKIGSWNETLPIIQDARFFLDAALWHGTFVHVPETLAIYRVHQTSSLSKSNKFAFILDCYVNACQVQEFWQARDGITIERKIALLKVYGQVARFFFEHDRAKFHEILLRLYQLDLNYLPTEPQSLRFFSQWLGYEQAESISLTYRRIKNFVGFLPSMSTLNSN